MCDIALGLWYSTDVYLKTCSMLIVVVCVTVQITAADAVLTAVDASSDVEASDDDDDSHDNGTSQDVDEVNESESDTDSSDDDVPLTQTRKISCKEGSAKQITGQKCSKFTGPSRAADSNENPDKSEDRREWGKAYYFEQYIDEKIFEQICDSTNR